MVRQQADNAARAGDHLRESFEASLAELTRERDEARELSQKLDAEVGQLAKKLAESQAAAVKAAANARAQPSIGNQGSPGSSMKTLAEVFKKPEMKDVVVQQNLAQLDMIYGKLYDRLQLDNSEKQDLKSLLSERMRATSVQTSGWLDTGCRSMNPDGSDFFCSKCSASLTMCSWS